MVTLCLVAGSYMDNWRPELARGVSFAETRSEPALQNAGSTLPGRIRAVYHRRPLPSNIGLCTVVWLSQMASSSQNVEGCNGFGCPGVLASRYGVFTCAMVLCTGSRTG